MSTKKLSNEIIDDKLKDRPILRLDDYINSRTKILFKCKIDGHEWLAEPNKITNSKRGCPKCSGNIVLTNQIVDERIKGRNLLRIGEVKGGHNKIKWKCLVDGYEWSTTPSIILSNNGCPKCAGVAPLTNEYIDEMLSGRTIIRIGQYKNVSTKLKFKCLIDEHEFEAFPLDVINRKSGCKKCSNTIVLTNELLDEKLKDRSIIRIGDVKGNKRKISFKCKIDGYEWEAQPNSILGGSGCAKCSNNIPLTNDIIDERIKHRTIIRIGDVINSSIKIKWKCLIDEHEWEATPQNIIGNQSGCPKCFKKNEKRIQQYLIDMYGGDRVKIQHTIKIDESSRITIDFVVGNCFIEYNGQQHYQPVRFNGMSQAKAETAFINQQKRDESLRQYCSDNIINLIEIPHYLSEQEQYNMIKNL